ncbi:unnamed protein product [Arabis nemorensis]|uniref:Jacalin-type lectin domain-containing protein n=1 Tax=Arabis nemorensis TaxID=586526 RepID=A0A565B955_9BRAS|nr:unnamed protein product [Arabis nemorensis]
MFEYINGFQVVIGDERGKMTLLGFEQFEINYPSEYTIKYLGVTLRSLPCLAGTSFELKEEGKKVVGFHGRANEPLHQFGAYDLPITN